LDTQIYVELTAVMLCLIALRLMLLMLQLRLSLSFAYRISSIPASRADSTQHPSFVEQYIAVVVVGYVNSSLSEP